MTQTKALSARGTRTACLAAGLLTAAGLYASQSSQVTQGPPAQPPAAVQETAPTPPPVAPLPGEGGAPAKKPAGDVELEAESVLAHTLLVTWYGNPHSKRMGILGEYTGDELADGLRRQAEAFAPLTTKRVQPAYELVAVVAQNNAGRDGKWRRRESRAMIERVLAEARAHEFKLILDVQVGHSTVAAELEYLRRYLEEPDVYLALDPEFDMPEGQAPGTRIGTTPAADVNYAIDLLERIVIEKRLPPKVLIAHQFTMNMLPDKRNVADSPVVDVALVMDGWGPRQLKHAIYRMVTRTPLEHAGIKLFYKKEPDLFAPSHVLALTPTPSIVIYQ